jgi:hypothetical protein
MLFSIHIRVAILMLQRCVSCMCRCSAVCVSVVFCTDVIIGAFVRRLQIMVFAPVCVCACVDACVYVRMGVCMFL